MNRVAADLSWYQKLKRRLALRALRHNVWHEYQDGLCCEVEFKDGDLRYHRGDWCDCSTNTQRREVAHHRRVEAGGYAPVTPLGPPPQGEPALAPASPPRCWRCGTTAEVSAVTIHISGGYARHHHLCLTCRVALGALITLFLNGWCFTSRVDP